MTFMRGMCVLLSLSLAEANVYVYNTHDSPSVELYDCIFDQSLPYCRRPVEPTGLARDHQTPRFHHNGILQLFTSFASNYTSVSTVLHQWKSSVGKAEEYARYVRQLEGKEALDNAENYLCECKDPQSFGKHCEYLLPVGTTLEEALQWQVHMRTNHWWEMQRFGDIVCLTTLTCNYGLLCLDWRDICDGVQNCMAGVDEENCDKLEFNECEDDEYRCMNGMCIPQEYFLDGEYDCMDLSDEREPFDDTNCTYQRVHYECDDRLCLPYDWSCGDGQCIRRRLAFQTNFGRIVECESRREQYHMCETNSRTAQWTLPNGRCYDSYQSEATSVPNRTASEECIYFVKCALSQGADTSCPCQYNPTCTSALRTPCTSRIVAYPAGAVIAPYIFTFYYVTRNWFKVEPDFIEFTGAIKCRAYMVNGSVSLQDSPSVDIHAMEADICASSKNLRMLSDIGYDRSCHKHSRTFSNRSYHFIDVCQGLKECISAYRIHDGLRNCDEGDDEKQDDAHLVRQACSNVQRHRFHCSDEQPTCLLVRALGDQRVDCVNSRDQRWMASETMLSELACNTQSKRDCQLIRWYIEASTTTARENSSHVTQPSTRMPFHSLCDTFFDSNSRNDEDTLSCQSGWQCRSNEWQCHTKQCIPISWLLDNEWDCSDASDEQAVFASANALSAHNSRLTNSSWLNKKFTELYSRQPFGRSCNLTREYPCIRADTSDPLAIERYHPCINLHAIGDGHVDCVGGIDERNNIERCESPLMLGYFFQCPDKKECKSFALGCFFPCRDSRLQCFGKGKDGCEGASDFLCLNGSCVVKGWCNEKNDCDHGEDEYMCGKDESELQNLQPIYREKKEKQLRTTRKDLRLPRFPQQTNRSKLLSKKDTILWTRSSLESMPPSIAYWCNRGVGVLLYDKSIVCLCPPQYYGDKCQYHNDRMTFLFHLDLSHSIYAELNHHSVVLQLLVIFLHDNQPLMTELFDVPSTLDVSVRKMIFSFLYSRSNHSIELRRARYRNRSSIENYHPYSIRIEAYELHENENSHLVGVWLYPVYFDYLPSFRLAKILRLTKPSLSRDPCSSSPCGRRQECHRLLNDNSSYACLCPSHFKGNDCSTIDERCQANFCSSTALCKPNYRGLLNGNERPLCICSLHHLGDRCELSVDRDFLNRCQNKGVLGYGSKPDRFVCLCTDAYYGKTCELEKEAVVLALYSHIEHNAALVQYFVINFYSLDLTLAHQHVEKILPHTIKYRMKQEAAPEIILVKFYSATQTRTYLVSLQINVTSINTTTETNERNHCDHVDDRCATNDSCSNVSSFEYHRLCIDNVDLLCFMDEAYLCICDQNHTRVECFNYDHSLDRCSRCFADGRCIRGDLQTPKEFVCICSPCTHGHLCQFSSKELSFTLDALIGQDSRGVQVIHVTFAVLIFFLGTLTNYASFITFKRPTPRKYSVGNYLLLVTMFNQCSLVALLIKVLVIFVHRFMSTVSCKSVSYILSVSTRYTFWMTSWVTVDRVLLALFPFGAYRNTPRIAYLISLITLLVVGGMHAHELIFYTTIHDLNGQMQCVANFPLYLSAYNHVNIMIHHLVPFSIQVLCVTLLIVLMARSRARTNNERQTFLQILRRQLNNQKELYIMPLIIVFTGLPQIIISSTFSCQELSAWQRHLLTIAYFLSYAPQLLGFVLFVLPSTSYLNEFRQTKFSKTLTIVSLRKSNKQ